MERLASNLWQLFDSFKHKMKIFAIHFNSCRSITTLESFENLYGLKFSERAFGVRNLGGKVTPYQKNLVLYFSALQAKIIRRGRVGFGTLVTTLKMKQLMGHLTDGQIMIKLPNGLSDPFIKYFWFFAMIHYNRKVNAVTLSWEICSV